MYLVGFIIGILQKTIVATCEENALWRITENSKELQTKRQKEPGETKKTDR